MELLKNNKGITLVMLVVTIIVLLILAGISISAITGGDSSMDKAKKAKDETAIKAEMEELQEIINQSAAKGIRHGNYSGSADSKTIRDALKKNKLIEENPDDVIIDGKNGWKVTGVKTGQKYKIRYDGEVTRIEELAPTKIYGKIADGVLYLRATEQTGYTEGTQWNDSTITKVIIEELIVPSTCYKMFYNCYNIRSIENIENLHTENSTNMSHMFKNCRNLTSLDLTYFDTSKVTDMSSMFQNCISLKTLDVSNFDTSNVLLMNNMFSGTQTISANFNTDYDYRMNLKSIKGLTSFNTSNVTNMNSMFFMCINLDTLDVSSFDTSKVTDMSYMFSGWWQSGRIAMNITKISGLSNFNTLNVTNMKAMFFGCENLKELNLRNFKTSNVKDMSCMFMECNGLEELDISNFDTKNVINMTQMFRDCENLQLLELTTFNTNNVTTMEQMFYNCKNLKKIYASNNFFTENVTNSYSMFAGLTNIIGGNGTNYSSSHIKKEYAHIDGGPSNPGYFTSK